MTVQGHIEKGQVVLDAPLQVPDGAKVTVLIEVQADDDHAEQLPSLYERMKSVIGKAEGLPPDMAINHDHYLHGQPKRQ
jgi:hypothetical protein